jgi:hypothetical protein
VQPQVTLGNFLKKNPNFSPNLFVERSKIPDRREGGWVKSLASLIEKSQTKAGHHFDALFSTVAASASDVCGASGPLFVRAFLACCFFAGVSAYANCVRW